MMTNEVSHTQLPSRPDYDAIAAWIKPESRVLDLGCGDGSLLRHLKNQLNVHGYGIEIDTQNILACFEKIGRAHV